MSTTSVRPSMQRLKESCKPLLEQLASHEVWGLITKPEHLRHFMESHVYCVWDFMSLLKSLQLGLTCIAPPWLPVGKAEDRRLINEIVLEEESDDVPGIGPISHFEMYLGAMKEAGANTSAVESFINMVDLSGEVDDEAIKEIPWLAAEFVDTTFDFINTDRLVVVAAAFTIGREQAIPVLFGAAVGKLVGNESIFMEYLKRHIELDGDSHGPKSEQLLKNLCGEDELLWREAETAAVRALTARSMLLDGLAAQMKQAESK